MILTTIKCQPISPGHAPSIFDLIDSYVTDIREKDVLVIASKVVAICEGRVLEKRPGLYKETLVPKYAQWYLPASRSTYGFCITITQGMMTASAGIDESNGNGYFILWPDKPLRSARQIWQHIRERRGINICGVVINDSRTTPMRRGVTSQAIAWCGIRPLLDYRGAPDIFGQKLKVTRMNIVDNIASAASLEMGEGRECAPFAVLRDCTHIQFVDHPPDKCDRYNMKITLNTDLYGIFLKNAPWRKGVTGLRNK